MAALDDHERRDFAASGGRASGKALTPEERTQKARKAARARWENRNRGTDNSKGKQEEAP